GATPLSRYEDLLVEPDGTVLIITSGQPQKSPRTLDGQTVLAVSKSEQTSGAYLRAGRVDDSYVSQRGWEARVIPLADNALPPTYWYFVLADDSADGRGYFAGYNSETRLPVGFIGREGFTSALPGRDGQFTVYGPWLSPMSTLFISWAS